MKKVELKESNEFTIEFLSLKEAQFNKDFSSVEVVLIEQGTNEQKKRRYPVETIQEATPLFKGLKMYLNHPTPSQEKERPERDLKEWMSTIVESRFENGKAVGTVSIHDPWLRERLADPVFRANVGLSINAGGVIKVKDGYQIVEKILPYRQNGPASVDWVTEAGARGRVNKLLENNREKKMELDTLTLKELKEGRADIVNTISESAIAPVQKKLTETEQALKESNEKLAAANQKLVEVESKGKISAQLVEVDGILKEAKIPDASKERVRKAFETSLVGDVKESVRKAIEDELAYVNKISKKGAINLGGTSEEGKTLKESYEKELTERAGIQVKKEDSK